MSITVQQAKAHLRMTNTSSSAMSVSIPTPGNNAIEAEQTAHCLDILRQQLMCTIDVGVFGQVWLYPDAPEPFVDFNTQHRCRNFEQIREWAEKHQLPEHPPSDFLEPPQLGDRIYTDVP